MAQPQKIIYRTDDEWAIFLWDTKPFVFTIGSLMFVFQSKLEMEVLAKALPVVMDVINDKTNPSIKEVVV